MKLRSTVLFAHVALSTYIGCSGSDPGVQVGDASPGDASTFDGKAGDGSVDGALGQDSSSEDASSVVSDVGTLPPQEASVDAAQGDAFVALDAGGDANDAKVCLPTENSCKGICTPVSSPDHCGTCDHLCGKANAVDRGCQGGICEWKCLSGFDHCGKDDGLGCDTSIERHPEHCGGCGKACADGLICFQSSCDAPTHLPDSKDKKCSDGSIYVPCGSSTVGQDGDYEINVPFFVTTSETARDAVTGLTWERGSTVSPVDAAGMQSHCDALNKGGIGGRKDWRIPSPREAMTIANMGANGPGLDTTVFPAITNAGIWTSTTSISEPLKTWVLGGNYPVLYPVPTTSLLPGSHCVAGPAFPEATLGVSGSKLTVVDKTTSLMWQRESSDAPYSWMKAVKVCDGLSLDGFDDWRLPNAKELFSIVDVSAKGPAFDTATLLPPKDIAQTLVYWTSSPFSNFATLAYSIDFSTGYGQYTNGKADVANAYSVRCVRGGTK